MVLEIFWLQLLSANELAHMERVLMIYLKVEQQSHTCSLNRAFADCKNNKELYLNPAYFKMDRFYHEMVNFIFSF